MRLTISTAVIQCWFSKYCLDWLQDLDCIVFPGIGDRSLHVRLPSPRDARVPNLGQHHKLLHCRRLVPVNIFSHLALLSSGLWANDCIIVVSFKEFFQSASYPPAWLAESSQAETNSLWLKAGLCLLEKHFSGKKISWRLRRNRNRLTFSDFLSTVVLLRLRSVHVYFSIQSASPLTLM